MSTDLPAGKLRTLVQVNTLASVFAGPGYAPPADRDANPCDFGSDWVVLDGSRGASQCWVRANGDAWQLAVHGQPLHLPGGRALIAAFAGDMTSVANFWALDGGPQTLPYPRFRVIDKQLNGDAESIYANSQLIVHYRCPEATTPALVVCAKGLTPAANLIIADRYGAVTPIDGLDLVDTILTGSEQRFIVSPEAHEGLIAIYTGGPGTRVAVRVLGGGA